MADISKPGYGQMPTMAVVFTDNDGTKPDGLLAEAELHFITGCGPLDGLKLVGFSIRKSPAGGTFVTLPSRAFGQGADRRYFDYVRSIDGDHARTGAVKDYVRAAWKERQGEGA